MSRATDCAYPAVREDPYVATDGVVVGTYSRAHGGLTIREHFAAMAMSGALGGVPGSHLIPETLARDSVAHADALILALSKGQS